MGRMRQLLQRSKLHLNGQEKAGRRGGSWEGVGRRQKQAGCGILRRGSWQTWSGRDGAGRKAWRGGEKTRRRRSSGS